MEKWLPETHLLVSIREAKRLLRATPIAIAIIAPRAQARCTMSQVGLVFDHAEYGQCSVLGTIQWIDQRAGQIKVLMQEQVAFVGLLAGCVNDKLERTRRVRIDAHSDGVPPEKKTTDRIFLSPMQSKMLETVLLLAGFFEEEDGLWASVDDEAIKRFLGPSAHVERANVLRKIWYYTRLELAQGRRGRSKVVFTLFDPQAASEKVRATRTRGASAILTLC